MMITGDENHFRHYSFFPSTYTVVVFYKTNIYHGLNTNTVTWHNTVWNNLLRFLLLAFGNSPGRRDYVRECQHERVVLLTGYTATSTAAGGRHKFGRRIPRQQNSSKYHPIGSLSETSTASFAQNVISSSV